jgi:hypothetical protein
MQMAFRALFAALAACGTVSLAQAQDTRTQPLVIPFSLWPPPPGSVELTALSGGKTPYECKFDKSSDCPILVLTYPPNTPAFSKPPFDKALCTAQVTVEKIAVAQEIFNTAAKPHTITWHLEPADSKDKTVYQFDPTIGIDLHSRLAAIAEQYHAEPVDLDNNSVGGGGRDFSWQAINQRTRPRFPWLCSKYTKGNCDLKYVATVTGNGIACQVADPLIILGGP